MSAFDFLGDLPRTGRFLLQRRRLAARDDDVFVASYPRSGTTWLSYATWLLFHPEAAAAKADAPPPFAHLGEAVPWYERSLARGYRTAEDLDALPGPRVMKTHLHPAWLPRRGRVLYAVRQVEDVVLSYWKLYRSHLGYRGDLDAFVDRFVAGRVQYRRWSDHVAAWSRSGRNPLLLVRYEALRQDPEAQLAEIARFLHVCVGPDEITSIARRSSLSAMKRFEDRFDHATDPHGRPRARRNRFFGAGEVGAGSGQLSTRSRQKLSALEPHRLAGFEPRVWAYLR